MTMSTTAATAETLSVVTSATTTVTTAAAAAATPRIAVSKKNSEPMDLSTPQRYKRNRESGSPNDENQISKVRFYLR